MISKETVRNLILDIKKLTGNTQAEIAEHAGFKPESLSQQLSRGESLESIHARLMEAYRKELEMYKQTYSTRPANGSIEGIKKPDEGELIRQYQELIKQLQETVKQQKQLIDKLLEKT